jgi:ELWxxDGT repeat protein/probable HAF family extracellular repeat protein
MTTYTYQTIDPPGSTNTVADSINDNGQIVGSYSVGGQTSSGFLDNNGTYTTIDPPGSVGAGATDINSLGQIVGTYQIAGGPTLGFLYSHGTYTTIDPPGSLTGYHFITINGNLSINKTGQIVGTYRDNSTAVDHGFLYSAGKYTALNFPGASSTQALAIGNGGQVVGDYEYVGSNGIGNLTGFLYSHGAYTTIGPPGGFYTYLTSINKSGTIVGHYQQSSGGPEQGFVYSHGTYTPIEYPGAVSTVPISINDKGQITGYYQTSSITDPQHAFVYSNGQYTTLNPPASFNSPSLDPLSINNSGQIVGAYSEYNTDTTHGFVATDPPTSSPTTAADTNTNASTAHTKPTVVVMFAGTDAAGDRGVWVTDGTAAGTHELTGISGTYSGGLFGGSTGFPPDFTAFNGKVLFSGLDAAGTIGLWVTDGTAGGTYELTNITNAKLTGLFSGYFPGFTVFNGEVLFNGNDAAGNAGLWVTDGTAAGTHELTGINGASPVGLFGGYNPDFIVVNGEVLFSGRDSSNNFSLWVTDGTAVGTHQITVPGALTAPGSGGLFGGAGNNSVAIQPDLTIFNGKVLFEGVDANAHVGLWVTDGTTAGTHEITTFGGPIGSLTVFNGEVLFTGPDRGLWVTDGTAGGTHELTGITGAAVSGFDPGGFTVFKNQVLFTGTDAAGVRGLWVTNGTAAGTHELTGIKGAYSGGLEPSTSFTVI